MTYPKIELHVHLEGAIRPQTLFALAAKNKVTLPVDTLQELEDFYVFSDFNHFVDVWNVTTDVLFDADDFRRVVVEYAKEAASFGVSYFEGIFSPGQYYVRGIDGQALFEGFTDGIQAAREETGVEVRLTPDLDRRRPIEISERIVADAVKFRDRGIVGLGLGGRERADPASKFADVFRFARDHGLASVPHAGEDAGPESVRDVIDVLHAHRVRHGIRAIEDATLVDEIIDRDIVLDVCPTSNLRTRVIADWKDHPLPELIASGIPLTINTDDPAMFGTDLGVEHRLAIEAGADPRALFEAGILGQLAGDEVADRLRAIADAHWGVGAVGADGVGAADAAADGAGSAR